MSVYDFSNYELKDLFKIRDALNILDNYGLAHDEILMEVNAELQREEEKHG